MASSPLSSPVKRSGTGEGGPAEGWWRGPPQIAADRRAARATMALRLRAPAAPACARPGWRMCRRRFRRLRPGRYGPCAVSGCPPGTRWRVARPDQVGAAHRHQRLAQHRPVVRVVIAQEGLVQAPLPQALHRLDLFRGAAPHRFQRIEAASGTSPSTAPSARADRSAPGRRGSGCASATAPD